MKQVSIIGGSDSWQLAPRDSECWGVTGTVTYRPVDRAFDMHDLTWTEDDWYRHYRIWVGPYKTEEQMRKKAFSRWHAVEYEIRAIKEARIPFYSVRAYENIPSSVAYPIDDVISRFDDDYFSSTFDYTIALALHEGYEKIDIYGCQMDAADEYAYQQPSFSYWLGIAKGMGVKFKVHGQSNLLQTSRGLMYGYNSPRSDRRI